MPTVLRSRGLEVRLYPPPGEHGPPHVHVWCANGVVVVRLAGEIPQVIQCRGNVGRSDIARVLALVKEHNVYLLRRWREIHG